MRTQVQDHMHHIVVAISPEVVWLQNYLVKVVVGANAPIEQLDWETEHVLVNNEVCLVGDDESAQPQEHDGCPRYLCLGPWRYIRRTESLPHIDFQEAKGTNSISLNTTP